MDLLLYKIWGTNEKSVYWFCKFNHTLQFGKSGWPLFTVAVGIGKDTNVPFIFVNYLLYYDYILAVNVEYLLVCFK